MKNKNNLGVVIIVSILLSFVCGVIGAYLVVNSMSTSNKVIKNITTSELVENSIASSVDNVYGATVAVMSYNNDNLKSTGTGFLYKKDSNKYYIMTNYHVIDGADKVKVSFNDSDEKIDATILGGEAYSDIAVLTISSKDDHLVVEIGDSESIRLGDTIFTVGNPMGIEYKGTVTKGILSGKERLVEVSLSGSVSDYYMKVLQIDAAVNPGNSGGPLCDVSGKVIGIISLKIVQDSIEGMGFAIPIEDALSYVSKIEKGEKIVRPFVGVSMLDLSDEYNLWRYRITLPDDVNDGVAVLEVSSDSPAAKAGLKKGDIIVKINDNKVSSIAEFRYELYKHEVGEKIELTIYRDNKKQKLTVTLGKSE